MEVSPTNWLLPATVLNLVFHLLPPRDLKAVVLVCRWWREVGEAPALWVWVCIRVKGENHGYIKEFLDSRRLQAVRRIEVREEMEVSEELLQTLVRRPGLKEMRVQSTDLSAVDPELLAQAVTQLEEVVHTRLTPQQVTAICTAMTGNSRLKTLYLLKNNLSSVDAGLLAQAVTQIEEVELGGTDLTPQQVNAICSAMTGNSQLKTLNLFKNNLSSVDAGLLAQAVTQLEEVKLGDTRLTPQQVEAIFAALDTFSHLKILRICVNNLSSVDPEVLARVVNKLETVNMWATHLTRQQMTRILTQSLLTTNLKYLNMEGNGGVEEEISRQAEQFIQDLIVDRYESDIEDEDSDD